MKIDMGLWSTAYGLTISSNLRLPELKPVTETCVPKAHLAVSLGHTASKDELAVKPLGDFSIGREEAWLTWPTVGRFEIGTARSDSRSQSAEASASTVLIHPAAGVDDATLRAFLLGPVLAVVLYQRGFLILHASAIAFQDCDEQWGALGFLGHSGAGKSTMVAALHARGHRVISDDIIAIPVQTEATEKETSVAIYPGYPQLRLWPQSLAALGQDAEALPLLYPQEDRRVQCVNRYVDDDFGITKLPLHRLYVLAKGDTICAQALTPLKALTHLIQHSYCMGLVETAERAVLYGQSADLARHLPVYQLQRPRDLDSLADVAAFVEKECGI